MCMLRKGPGSESASSSSCSSSSSSSQPHVPAKRTKFRDTRHPVYRGVRRRGGGAGRWPWVCEVRAPGARGLWLGAFRSAEAAARAHDAAVLALRGAARPLNFPDSDWLLDVPPPAALRTAGDVRRAVARAVDGFLQLRHAPLAAAAEDAMSATSEPPAAAADAEASSAPDVAASARDDVQEASPFEQDVLCDMGSDLYYASLAEALLMEAPASDASCCEDGECDASGAPLWSY